MKTPKILLSRVLAALLLLGLAGGASEARAQRQSQRYAQQPDDATRLEWATALVREKRFAEAEALLDDIDSSYFPKQVKRLISLLRADIELSKGHFGFAKTRLRFAVEDLEYGDPGYAYMQDLLQRVAAAEKAYEAKRDAEAKEAWAKITGSGDATSSPAPAPATPPPAETGNSAAAPPPAEAAQLDALFAQFGSQFNAQNWSAAKATLKEIDVLFAGGTLQPSPVYYANYGFVLYQLREYDAAKRQLGRYFQMANSDEPNYQGVRDLDKAITAAIDK